MDLYKVVSGVAYVITRGACETMIDTLLPVRHGTDHWGAFQAQGAFQTLRCVVPRTVGLRTDFKSAIGYVDRSSVRGQVAGVIARRRLFPLHQLLSLRRARIERQMSQFSLVDQPPPSALVD
jgi:hypothetical protein